MVDSDLATFTSFQNKCQAYLGNKSKDEKIAQELVCEFKILVDQKNKYALEYKDVLKQSTKSIKNFSNPIYSTGDTQYLQGINQSAESELALSQLSELAKNVTLLK